MFHDKGRLPLRRTNFDTEFTTNIAALCLRALSSEQTADASDQLGRALDRVIKNARTASDADDQVLALSHDLQRSLDEGHADPDRLRCLAQTVATKLQSRPVPSPDLYDLALTGLGNLHAFDLMVADLKEHHILAGFILSDLDGLKRINTIAGFSAGDLSVFR